MDERPRQNEPPAPDGTPARRPYTAPKLTRYGSVTQLTAGSLSKQSDAPFAGFKRA